jgi:hypothetical protein
MIPIANTHIEIAYDEGELVFQVVNAWGDILYITDSIEDAEEWRA